MRLVYLTTVFILILVIFGPAILGFGIRKIPSGFQHSLTDTQILFSDITISQSFVAKQDRLSAVALTVKNPYFRNKKDLQFLITSADGEFRQVTINGNNIPDGEYLYFNFAPFQSSANKTFTYTLTSPQTTPTESLEFYHSSEASDGVYVVNGEMKEGSLSFVSYYSPENILVNGITIYRNWFWKLFQDLPFAIFYLTVLVGTIGYLSNSFSKRL